MTPEPFRRDRRERNKNSLSLQQQQQQQPHSPNSALSLGDDATSDGGEYDPIRADAELDDPLDASGELPDSDELRRIVETAAEMTGLNHQTKKKKQATTAERSKRPTSAAASVSSSSALDASTSSSQPGAAAAASATAAGSPSDPASLQRQIASERVILSDLMNKLNTLQSHSSSLQTISTSSRAKQQQMAEMMSEGQKKTHELEEQRRALQKQLDEMMRFGEEQEKAEKEMERREKRQGRKDSDANESNKSNAASGAPPKPQQQPQQQQPHQQQQPQQRGRPRTTTKAPPHRSSHAARTPSTSSVDASSSPIIRPQQNEASDDDEIDADAAQLAQLEDLMAHLASTADVQRRSATRTNANTNGTLHEEEEEEDDDDDDEEKEEREIDERLFYGRQAMEQAKQEQQRLRNLRSTQQQQQSQPSSDQQQQQQQQQHHQRHRTGIQAQNVARKIGAIESVLHPSTTSAAASTTTAERHARDVSAEGEERRERARRRAQMPEESPRSDFSVSPSPIARTTTTLQQSSSHQQQQQRQRPQSAQSSPSISAVPASRVPPVPISRWIGPAAMPSAGGSGRHAVYADRPATAVGTTRGAVSGRNASTTSSQSSGSWQVPTFSTLSNRSGAAGNTAEATAPSISSKSSMIAHAESSSEGSYTQRRERYADGRRDDIQEDQEEEEEEEEEAEEDDEEDEEYEDGEEEEDDDYADDDGSHRASAPHPYAHHPYLDSDSELATAINPPSRRDVDVAVISSSSTRPKTARARNPAENLNGMQRTSARPDTITLPSEANQSNEARRQPTYDEMHSVLAEIGAALYRHTISLTTPDRPIHGSNHYSSASTFGGPALGAGRLGAQRYQRPESAPQIAKERVKKATTNSSSSSVRARAWQ